MKRFKKMFIFLLSLCLLNLIPCTVHAEEGDYTYTVRFISGAHGKFKGGEVITYENMRYGDRITFHQSMVALEDKGKYYVRGIRESGMDNSTFVAEASFEVTGDQDYVVAYGILGDAVAYTVNYLDENGTPIRESETYYGNVGDEAVVAYRYIENYLPNAYNMTGVLQADASKNVFNFVYRRMSPAAQQAAQQAASEAAPQTFTPPTTTPATPDAPDAPEEPATPGIEEMPDDPTPTTGDAEMEAGGNVDGPPAETETINDGETPLARQDLEGRKGVAKLLWELPLAAKVGICSAVFLLGGAGGYVLSHRKRKVKDEKK